MGSVAHLLAPRTRERTTTAERHQQMGRIAHRRALSTEDGVREGILAPAARRPPLTAPEPQRMLPEAQET